MAMNILLLTVLVTVVTVLSAEDIKKLYGTSTAFFICDGNPDTWLFSTDLSSTPVTLSNNDNSIEFDGDTVVIVKNLSANHEGLYWCKKDNTILTSFNLTILGITMFAGCPPPFSDNFENCDSGSVLTYSLGDTIVINVSWDFFGGGLRNGKQSIESISLKHADDDLVLCEMGKNCVGIEGIEFNYPEQNKIQVSIKNATTSDSGVYKAEARVFTQNDIIKTITWNVTVDVTSVVDSIVTVISSTSSSINGLQGSIPMTTSSNDGNVVTSMVTVSNDSASISTSQTVDISSTSTLPDISSVNISNTTKKQQEMIVIVVGVIISSFVLIILIIIAATVITCFIRRRCQFVNFLSVKSKFAIVADRPHKNLSPDKISITNGSSYANSFLSVPTADHQVIYEQPVLHSAAQDSSYLSNEYNSEKVTV